jgi:putative intracellular protease/amidase
MWGLCLDPIPVLVESRQGYRPLAEAKADRYDAVVFLGGHSADILMTDRKVLDFSAEAYRRGAIIGAIGAGSLPLIQLGILEGKRATGNNLVSYLIERTGTWIDTDVVRDGQLITAADTVNTPAFLRELGRAFDGGYHEPRRGMLSGKKILITVGEDFEDIELVVPTLEFLYRGAQVCLASYPALLRARPPLLGLDVVCGNFGVSIPLQEIPADCYGRKKLNEVDPDEYDLLMIPGAFNPWNMVSSGQPVEFLKRVSEQGKIIAPICHGPIPLAAAGLVQGKHLAGTGACEKQLLPLTEGESGLKLAKYAGQRRQESKENLSSRSSAGYLLQQRVLARGGRRRPRREAGFHLCGRRPAGQLFRWLYSHLPSFRAEEHAGLSAHRPLNRRRHRSLGRSVGS